MNVVSSTREQPILIQLNSDYDVFLSPLSDFKKAVEEAGKQSIGNVVYLDRGEEYRFEVRKEGADEGQAVTGESVNTSVTLDQLR